MRHSVSYISSHKNTKINHRHSLRRHSTNPHLHLHPTPRHASMSNPDEECVVHSPGASKKRRHARHAAATSKKREQVLAHLDSNISTFLMTLITIYALFSDDLRILTVDATGDIVYTVLSSVSFFLFLAEILLQCWCREKYMRLPRMSTLRTARERGLTWKERLYILRSALAIGSFYFWLDLLATVSLSFEIPWMSSSPSTSSSDGGIENARAGRASRAGARAARVIKVVRMIRLVRLVKLYKYFGDSTKQKKQRERQSAVVAPALAEYDDTTSKRKKKDDDDVDMPPESRVGTEMSDRTTKKVIVGILVMLIGIPLLQINDVQYKNEFGMQMVFERRQHLSNLVAADGAADAAADGADSAGRIQDATNDWLFSETLFLQTSECIYLEYDGFHDEGYTLAPIPPDRAKPSRLQGPEKTTVAISVSSREEAVPEVDGTGTTTNNKVEPKLQMVAIFDISARAREEAILGILLTTFVIGLLAVGTMTFSRDVNTLVILPIEKMVQLVRDISANPLGKDYSFGPDQIREMDDGMETTLLLRTISKIAGLMRVGFGEAGAEIIGKNLNATQSHDDEHNGGISFMASAGGPSRGSETAVNVLGNGTKIRSIFAFCDVRNFTDTTECLQEEVMLFVNRIAHILHSIVVQCDGAANKNIGDAFLLTWKLGLATAPAPIAPAEEGHRLAADKALYSLLKTMVEMIRYEDFICNFSPTALGALYERMPRYKCRIGCGLHVGWAVEGAIGSDKKIDASYISPHVNWSEHLESSTKEYGVAVLMSEPFYDMLSPEAKAHCRQVDRIKKGADITALYTYDANLDQEFSKPESAFDERKRLNTIRKQTRIQTQLKKGYRRMVIGEGDNNENRIPGGFSNSQGPSASSSSKGLASGGGGGSSSMGALGEAPDILIKPITANVWKQDEDMIRLRRHFTDEKRLLWKDGLDAYLSGDWSEATIQFNKVLHLSGGLDGPSRLLLSRIEANGGVAPNDWGGYVVG